MSAPWNGEGQPIRQREVRGAVPPVFLRREVKTQEGGGYFILWLRRFFSEGGNPSIFRQCSL